MEIKARIKQHSRATAVARPQVERDEGGEEGGDLSIPQEGDDSGIERGSCKECNQSGSQENMYHTFPSCDSIGCFLLCKCSRGFKCGG